MTNTTELLECGHPESPHSNITRGYGTDSNGKRSCYACCAAKDKADMIAHGNITLYLVKREDGHHVINWPGSLEFKCYHTTYSRYGGGFGSQRTNGYFTGPDGKRWVAVNRGDMDLARCKRLKN